jgi:hypothetical protein
VLVRVLGDLAPSLVLDLSTDSVAALDAFLATSFDGRQEAPPALVLGVGCYVGEVIRHTLGGAWADDGTLTGVGRVVETFPLKQARERFEQRTAGSLVTYVEAVQATA